ncbi:DJ-1/PfpI family protein [Bradyrhizobium sp. LHD-71]|uniref:DJ-1/PfpI family protein n=1 Tax=Bradyrhizobium sp. LHD-71 TaxID=3072141 RepID=UPI00280DEC0A|nr:DJ-1/PfpI family protein [Bradyrhizobium sp. LHD-71]MDQ8728489.1 DJ-1/PfpI family protein [Bradyrhizobium sp. LHD-71]
MKLRLVVCGLLGVAVLSLAGFGAWIAMLPPKPAAAVAPPIPRDEAAATLAALKPGKRARPVIAIIGINNATEVTDYLMPTGILRRADVADVVAVATKNGPVKLYPALTVQPDATAAEFDARHPDGADYVVVPAMEPENDPAALEWIRAQAAKGATIISVCAGAKVVSETGLLDGKRATTHWYYLDGMLEAHPTIRYVANRRMVVDDRVATTTGITASMPAMLTLIEAIAGREKAETVARELGVTHWDARHASEAFRFNRPFAVTVLGNVLAFWKREEFGIKLMPGMDEVSLALVADAWSRTYRSEALTFAAAADPITTRNGVRIIPDRVAARWPADQLLQGNDDQPPAQALHHALQQIMTRYGARTADAVAMQLEYPWNGSSR